MTLAPASAKCAFGAASPVLATLGLWEHVGVGPSPPNSDAYAYASKETTVGPSAGYLKAF